jgi:hypothetical protein
MPPARSALLLPLLALTACSGPGAAAPDGNVVFLTQPQCRTFVVKTYGGQFGVLENRESGYTPQAADLLEGDLERGDGVLQFIPDRALRQGEDARPIDVRVLARRVGVGEAQAQFRSACPLIVPDLDESLDDLDDDAGDA